MNANKFKEWAAFVEKHGESYLTTTALVATQRATQRAARRKGGDKAGQVATKKHLDKARAVWEEYRKMVKRDQQKWGMYPLIALRLKHLKLSADAVGKILRGPPP